jgi:hypothetical protein
MLSILETYNVLVVDNSMRTSATELGRFELVAIVRTETSKSGKTACGTQQRLKPKAICSPQLVIAVVHLIRAFPNHEQAIKPSLPINTSDKASSLHPATISLIPTTNSKTHRSTINNHIRPRNIPSRPPATKQHHCPSQLLNIPHPPHRTPTCPYIPHRPQTLPRI